MNAQLCSKSARANLSTRIRTMAGRVCLSLGVVLLVMLLPRVSGLDGFADPASPQQIQSGALSWRTDTVDPAKSVGAYTSVALDSAGRPYISYYDSSGVALKLAHFDGVNWQIEVVDSSGGKYTSLALDSSDRPHISYLNLNSQPSSLLVLIVY
jgi:hypothetical protein